MTRPARRSRGWRGGSAFLYTTSYTYNTAGRVLTMDPPGYGVGDVASFTYDAARGGLVMLSRVDPLVGATTYAYDPFNRLTQSTDPNGVSRVTAYDNLDRVTSTTHQGAAVADDLVTVREYDSFGDLLRTTLPRGNVVEHSYDVAGRLIAVQKKPNAATQGERTFYTLDGAGNRIQTDLQRWNGSAWVTESTSQTVFTSRCHPDRVVHADGTVTETAYDCNGNVAKVWDANHPSAGQTNPATLVYAYDVLDRPTTLTQPWGGAGGGNAVTSYSYDVQDHLASITDAELNLTTFTTSDRDRLTREVSNVSGTSDYTYNEHGKRIAETDARPVTVTRTFDALDRPTFVSYPDDGLDTTFGYDAVAVPFSKGRLTSIDRGASSLGFAYDRFGRRTQDGALSATYDKNGNRVTLGYPNGVTSTYAYDFADRPATLQMQNGANPVQTLVSASSYKAQGPLASLTLGNGLTETHAFNARYLPTSISVPGRLSWTYATDGVGNPTAITDGLNAANNRTYAYQSYQYFLTTGNGPWGARGWTYDKTGNRLTEVRGAATDTYSYLPNVAGGHKSQVDQVTPSAGAAATYDYDAAGDVLDNGSLTFLYGDDRRLASSFGGGGPWPNTTYAFDGRGFLSEAVYTKQQEAEDTDRTSPTYSSGGLLLHRATHRAGKPFPPVAASDGDWYVFYFAGRPVATLDNVTQGASSTSTLRYLTTDHLGTPILMTSTGGAQVWQGGFEPFGKDFSSAPTPLRLPGQWSDATWNGNKGYGLYYNVNRWYEDGRSRYTQADPIGLGGGPNLYQYVAGNPLLFTDPLGLVCQLTPHWKHCLARIFGEPVDDVVVHDYASLFTGLHGGAMTSRRNAIYLPTSCSRFWQRPDYVLHEYYHVLDQWNRGRVDEVSYLLESGLQWVQGNQPHDDNRFEREADNFMNRHVDNFKNCLGCTALPPNNPPPPPSKPVPSCPSCSIQ